jgi:hypothetical protein
MYLYLSCRAYFKSSILTWQFNQQHDTKGEQHFLAHKTIDNFQHFNLFYQFLESIFTVGSKTGLDHSWFANPLKPV